MPKSSVPLLHRIKRQLMQLRRQAYGLRMYIPGMRDRHYCEEMIGPLGYWNELQRYQMNLLKSNGLQPHHALLDIGCGPLQGGIAFIKYLNRNCYTGVDQSQKPINAGHKLIARHHLGDKEPRLIVSSSFGRDELGTATFDFFWASQILYYFNDEVLGGLLEMVRQRMRPGGKFLGDFFALDHFEFHYPENPGLYFKHTLESLQSLADKHGLKVRSLGTIEQYGYPKRLTLHTNLLFEFTAKDA